MAKKAVNTDQTKEPALVVDVGQFVAHAHRCQNVYEQLKQIEQRLQQRLGEVVDAFQRLEKVFPDVTASANDAPCVGPDQQAALADALVALCDTVRQTQFDQGMELLLENARREQAGNYQLAFSLYSLGWAQDRTAILDQLNELERLPKQADKFDPRAPSQQGVWQTVSHLFGYLVQCPNHGPEPPEWHPDRLEAARLSAELDKLAGKSGGEDSHARVDPVLENGTTKPGTGPLDNDKEPATELAENEAVLSEIEDGEKESLGTISPADRTSVEETKRESVLLATSQTCLADPESSNEAARRVVNWTHFAIGKVSRRNWQHFRYIDGTWRLFGRLKVRSGKQERLLDLFLEGRGCLTEEDALKLWYEPKTEDQRKEIMDKLEPEMTHLRNLIRKARKLDSKTTDPLPRRKDEGPKRWIAAIQFGGAGHQDSDYVSAGNQIRFIPLEAESDD